MKPKWRTVYAVETDEYDDRRTICLYEQREDAEKYIALHSPEAIKELHLVVVEYQLFAKGKK